MSAWLPGKGPSDYSGHYTLVSRELLAESRAVGLTFCGHTLF